MQHGPPKYDSDTLDVSLPLRWTSAAVFSSPHSGSEYPQALLDRSHLSMAALRSSEDAYVDELYSAAPGCGAPLLAARLPRAWVDLNRAANEYDPALIAGAPKSSRSPRINAGLGVIPRVVSEARTIFHGKLSMDEARARVEAAYQPYHDMLGAIISETRERFGYVVLFDCHSMPHDALAGSPTIGGKRPEVVLGDRFGASCDRWIMDAALDLFSSAGFRVARNAPFAGGYITQSYGKPSRNVHALQIEIDRSLYMNEATIERLPHFATVQRQVSAIVRELTQFGAAATPIAAE
jgi:N-formylglutamate amidohydrolase